MLFHAARSELEDIRPVAKFVCVKAVIFFSFWQSVAIVILVHMHVLTSRTLRLKDYAVKDVANGLQELIICIEMFFFSCGHQWAFPVSDFAFAVPATPPSKLSSVLDVLDMSDVYSDVRQELGTVGGRMRDRLPAAFKLPGRAAKAKAKGEEVQGLLERGEGDEEVDSEVGKVHMRDRHNMPFLAATGHYQRRSTVNDEAAEGATVPTVAVVTSPRSTAVSIGGREVELRELAGVTAASSSPTAAPGSEAPLPPEPGEAPA